MYRCSNNKRLASWFGNFDRKAFKLIKYEVIADIIVNIRTNINKPHLHFYRFSTDLIIGNNV